MYLTSLSYLGNMNIGENAAHTSSLESKKKSGKGHYFFQSLIA